MQDQGTGSVLELAMARRWGCGAEPEQTEGRKREGSRRLRRIRCCFQPKLDGSHHAEGSS